MQDIVIRDGTYRGQSVSGIKCKLTQTPRCGARGWFANVIVPGKGPIRVQLAHERAYEVISTVVTEEGDQETEEQVIERIDERFDIFKLSVEGVIDGQIRAMIVSGAAGIGKTETILRCFENNVKGVEHEAIRGNIVSSFQLYQILYDNNDENKVLILDDCDAILRDPTALNILKAALETGDRERNISYQSNAIINMGIPPKFTYVGRIIFISNEDFQRIVERDKSQLARHFKALIDRSMYLDLKLHSRHEVYCRIRQMVDNGLLDSLDLDTGMKDEILFWIKSNLESVRSLSLRTAIHVGELIRSNPENWQRMANAFLLRV